MGEIIIQVPHKPPRYSAAFKKRHPPAALPDIGLQLPGPRLVRPTEALTFVLPGLDPVIYFVVLEFDAVEHVLSLFLACPNRSLVSGDDDLVPLVPNDPHLGRHVQTQEEMAAFTRVNLCRDLFPRDTADHLFHLLTHVSHSHDCALLDSLSQFRPALLQPSPHGRNRDRQEIGDLLVWEPGDVMQDDRGTVDLGKL